MKIGGARLTTRALLAAGLGSALVAGGAVGATADTYNPPEEPTIKVTTLTPLCLDGDPYLDYAVTVTGTDHTTARLTWHNPRGADTVLEDQPLTGRVAWPGWADGDVDVTFGVNPEVTVTVGTPEDTEGCARTPGRPPLPVTGAQVGGYAGAAAGLVVLGGASVLVGRRLRRN